MAREDGAGSSRSADATRARRALQSLNFFMADMQAGIGPFLGVFLQQRGWATGPIGTVMTAGGVAGMAMTVPTGAFIDHTTRKRLVVVVTGVCTVAASFLILLSQSGWVVTVSQVATAIAGAAIGPAVAGMTLGIVRQSEFNAQNGRNQAFNHAGNMVGAALSGWLGWRFGMPAIFYLAAAFGVLAIGSVLLIPERAIDHDAARGLETGKGADDGGGKADGFRVLARNVDEVLVAYASFTAVIHHRVANLLHRLGAPLVARLIGEIAHAETGIDIQPAARIGRGFFIDHGTGVVIGATAIIGDRVRLFQGVTLGGNPDLAADKSDALRHPIVEDDVVIYANASIMGRVTIGARARIGGNVWLRRDVPPDTLVEVSEPAFRPVATAQ